jgi:hypothetical protein
MDYVVVVLLIMYSFLDAIQDKFNLAKYKRPNSRLPWPFIDLWHTIKRARMYLLSGFMCFYFLNYWQIAIAVIGSYIVWKIVPSPKHWR